MNFGETHAISTTNTVTRITSNYAYTRPSLVPGALQVFTGRWFPYLLPLSLPSIGYFLLHKRNHVCIDGVERYRVNGLIPCTSRWQEVSPFSYCCGFRYPSGPLFEKWLPTQRARLSHSSLSFKTLDWQLKLYSFSWQLEFETQSLLKERNPACRHRMRSMIVLLRSIESSVCTRYSSKGFFPHWLLITTAPWGRYVHHSPFPGESFSSLPRVAWLLNLDMPTKWRLLPPARRRE